MNVIAVHVLQTFHYQILSYSMNDITVLMLYNMMLLCAVKAVTSSLDA